MGTIELDDSDHLLLDNQAVALVPYQDRQKLVIVCGHSATLSTVSGMLHIEQEGQCLHESPWNHVDAIILFGPHHISTPAMLEALEHHVPIYLASCSGYYKGMIYNPRCANNGELWLLQRQCFASQTRSLEAAKTIVSARIRHIREMLRRKGEINAQKIGSQLKSSLRAVHRAQSIQELNGVEGNATRIYFAALKIIVPAIYEFSGRNRRPPRDPFNALISLGYTQLYAHVDALLRVAGLLPEVGFYHQQRSGHAALASDLMEPFRHVIERCALSLLQRKGLGMDDFIINDIYGCRMQASARRVYLGSLTEALLTPIKSNNSDQSLTILDHVYAQCMDVRRWIIGESECFEAWRMR